MIVFVQAYVLESVKAYMTMHTPIINFPGPIMLHMILFKCHYE